MDPLALQVLNGAQAAFLPDKEREELVQKVKEKLAELDSES